MVLNHPMTGQSTQNSVDCAPSPSPRLPKVAILLCPYEGERYLSEQLNSLAAQTYPHWTVFASDDGSGDGTCSILENYNQQWGSDRWSTLRGPKSGAASHFLSLTCNPEIQADYYAYLDQDDIWDADKLQRALDWLLTLPSRVPALYCSHTRLVDADARPIGFSLLFTTKPCFANALMQNNICGGNTMVFNKAARHLLCDAGKDVDVVAHDWWVYLVLSGCGGEVFYDRQPTLSYRQHDNNLLGMNSRLSAICRRVHDLWAWKLRNWNDRHIKALRSIRSRLTVENQNILDSFSSARNCPLWPRLIGIRRSGVHRQTHLGNQGLLIATLFKKI